MSCCSSSPIAIPKSDRGEGHHQAYRGAAPRPSWAGSALTNGTVAEALWCRWIRFSAEPAIRAQHGRRADGGAGKRRQSPVGRARRGTAAAGNDGPRNRGGARAAQSRFRRHQRTQYEALLQRRGRAARVSRRKRTERGPTLQNPRAGRGAPLRPDQPETDRCLCFRPRWRARVCRAGGVPATDTAGVRVVRNALEAGDRLAVIGVVAVRVLRGDGKERRRAVQLRCGDRSLLCGHRDYRAVQLPFSRLMRARNRVEERSIIRPRGSGFFEGENRAAHRHSTTRTRALPRTDARVAAESAARS